MTSYKSMTMPRMNLVMTIGYMQLMQDFVMTLLNSTCKSA